jgi:DNA polymerase-4
MNVKTRRIIHLDMDAFYASVEQLDNPELKGRPVIVGGTSKRGVVSAASYEAREYKIHSAMPIAQAMEPISLDEAFLDVTGSGKLFGTAEDIAEKIRADVFAETGLTISAGVASCKLLAKIASDMNKPDGLTIVPPGGEAGFLAPLPIKKLWGVGKKTQESLGLLGVKTIGDLAELPLDLLEKKFGKHGRSLHNASLGFDYRDVDTDHETKSVGHEFTFDSDLVELVSIRKELLELAGMVAKRLRRYQFQGRTITLKVKYHDFKQITRSSTIKGSTADSKRIFQEVLLLLKKTDAGKKPLRLLGISVGLKLASGARQQFLFDGMQPERKRQEINRALDEIQKKYGATAILPGRLLGEE